MIRYAGRLVFLFTCACVPQRAAAPSPGAQAGLPSGAREAGTQPGLDTEASLWPDPRIRTNVRLTNLQYLLEDHERRHGSLPASLGALRSGGQPSPDMLRDAWDNPIAYATAADDYELRAPGPDGALNTHDDIIARRGTELPVRGTEPGSRTMTIMESLQLLVDVYGRRNGMPPQSLEALAASGLSAYLGTIDEWGNAIRYTRTENGFEFRSAGPDGTIGSPDDLTLREYRDLRFWDHPAIYKNAKGLPEQMFGNAQGWSPKLSGSRQTSRN